MSHKWQAVLLLALAILLVAGVAGAQSGSGYDLRWNVVAAGGGRSTGSGWTAAGHRRPTGRGRLGGLRVHPARGLLAARPAHGLPADDHEAVAATRNRRGSP